MPRGVNKVILIGNLGQDPEVRTLASGDALCSLSVATSESWKDKQTGEMQTRTEWHKVIIFKRLAEIAGEYLRKGRQVYIEGSLRTRKWQDKDGVDRYTTEIVASDLQMLGGKGEGGGAAPPSRQASKPAANDTAAAAAGFDADDDDIPFALPLAVDGIALPGERGA